ncbi:RNA polymerase factor sigma-54 [Lentibacillus sediminis]|uniref:RNA polymerase factor sigma-54 n=1 Tax=Lentibacillus sediminis TaxID=1940529 RepID=UPI000C1BE847|nr:RNA polymerase factor sigma-54 [Lentibacillus sediminis]
MKPRMVQEQRLQWKMNQSLLQSIHILQFSGLELLDYIQEAAKDNPLIEEVNYDADLATYRSEHASPAEIGEINPTELTFHEQLKSQLYTLDIPGEIMPVVLFGIDSLNEDGYLEIDLDTWAEACGVTKTATENALEMIQSLEPVGVGARTLTECILLQFRQFTGEHPFIKDLLENHLEWIAEEDKQSISDNYQVSEEAASEAIDYVKACHPKPGQLLTSERSEYIIPEASVYKEDGVWKISFYKWNTPAIEVNQSYAELMEKDKAAADYLREKYKQVEWLRQAISYRSNTLHAVIREIVERQYLFFEHGSFMLQPLTLKEIADEVGVHLSTVSRAIHHKFIQTTQGVVALKFFFQPGVRQPDGKQTSAFAIKKLIQELIQHEDKAKPLSDEAIRNKLQAEFRISVARRTVMKYREQLNIPSSVKRK